MLIVEAVVASFLMLFAFIAAAQLFDASLRWESSSSNDRLAAFVAERRMEELRGWVEQQCKTQGFHSLNWASQEVVDDAYPDVPGFLITVRLEAPRYQPAKPNSGREDAPDGLHSPCSSFYVIPPATGNAQMNAEWRTYPYTRDMGDSIKLMDISVKYGTDGGREYKLVSLISDPVSPPASHSADFSVSPVKVTGPNSIASGSGTFNASLELPSGQEVQDVTYLWSTGPAESGAVIIRPTTPDAAEVILERSPVAVSGNIVDLTVRVLYRGNELLGHKDVTL